MIIWHLFCFGKLLVVDCRFEKFLVSGAAGQIGPSPSRAATRAVPVGMSRRVRDRCLELERAIAARFRSGSLGLDDAIKLFDELLPIARPASVCAFNQILTVVCRAQGRGSSPSSNGWSVPPQIR